MAEIRHYDKRVGITYVYSSESYYDKDKHQSRSRRKLIGKIDPATGEMVPTGKKGRPPKNPIPEDDCKDYRKLCSRYEKQLDTANSNIDGLRRELAESKRLASIYKEALKKISAICGGADAK